MLRVQARSQSTLRTSTVTEHGDVSVAASDGRADCLARRPAAGAALRPADADPRTRRAAAAHGAALAGRRAALRIVVSRRRCQRSNALGRHLPQPDHADGRRADGPAPHARTPIALEADGENLLASTSAAGALEYRRINLARGTQMKLQAAPPRVTAGLASRPGCISRTRPRHRRLATWDRGASRACLYRRRRDRPGHLAGWRPASVDVHQRGRLADRARAGRPAVRPQRGSDSRCRFDRDLVA